MSAPSAAAIENGRQQVAIFRERAERERARLNDAKLEDLAEIAKAHREGRPDTGKSARFYEIRKQQRILDGAMRTLAQSEAALGRMMDQVRSGPQRAKAARKAGRR